MLSTLLLFLLLTTYYLLPTDLLAENREYLKKGDYRLLYGVMEKCGYEPEDDEEPFYSSAQMKSLPHPVKELLTFIQIE